MNLKERENAITKTSVIGILANVFLVAFKAVAGLLSGSVAIILDAVNNLTDAMSSVITIAGIRLAKRRPNNDHPFGFGRVEYFSTILIAMIILAAGGTSMIESVKKIFDPELPDYSAVTIVIISASVLVKLLLGRYVKKQGEKYNSDALVASGADASFDAVISASTLVGAVITLIFHISVDGIVGAIISCFIIKAGIEMLLEALSSVLGSRPDSEVTKEIKAAIRNIPGVLGAYDLVLHNYGPESAMGSVHIEVPAEISAGEFHKLTAAVQEKVLEDFKIFMTVGLYAVDNSPEVKEIRDKVTEVCGTFPGVINSHGYFIDTERKLMTFDITVDFSVRDKEKFIDGVKEKVAECYPEYTVMPNLDTNYSD